MSERNMSVYSRTTTKVEGFFELSTQENTSSWEIFVDISITLHFTVKVIRPTSFPPSRITTPYRLSALLIQCIRSNLPPATRGCGIPWLQQRHWTRNGWLWYLRFCSQRDTAYRYETTVICLSRYVCMHVSMYVSVHPTVHLFIHTQASWNRYTHTLVCI
jgi:hypothetical protein